MINLLQDIIDAIFDDWRTFLNNFLYAILFPLLFTLSTVLLMICIGTIVISDSNMTSEIVGSMFILNFLFLILFARLE